MRHAGRAAGAEREPSREPHRESPVACDTARPCNDVAAGLPCSSHEVCTAGANGRCQRFGLRCTYDACTSDADCAPGTLCDCAGGSEGAHRCLPAECRTAW